MAGLQLTEDVAIALSRTHVGQQRNTASDVQYSEEMDVSPPSSHTPTEAIAAGREDEGTSSATTAPAVTVMELNLRSEGLTSIPSLVLSASFLHFLDLSHNSLTELPSALFNLKHLVHFNASNNAISRIPKDVGRLDALVRLDMSHNRLQGVPEEIGGCRSLQIIYLGANEFETWPKQLIGLPDLRRVYLGNNALTHVPASVGTMRMLEVLYLGGNRLRHVSTHIARLNRLQKLYLGDNELTDLPPLDGMRALRILNLHNNRIRTLPTSLLQLQQLRQLSLRGNPLVRDFVRDVGPRQTFSLKEICARTIKNNGVQYDETMLPSDLLSYLGSGCRCTNPECDGWYFTGVQTVEFVDVCGKYRVPLMKYICKGPCTRPAPVRPRNKLSSRECRSKMQRVLLTGYEEGPCDDPLCMKCVGSVGGNVDDNTAAAAAAATATAAAAAAPVPAVEAALRTSLVAAITSAGAPASTSTSGPTPSP
eukprot:UC1_evm2s1636